MKDNYTYDVAISFAEEDKGTALALSQAFDKAGLKAYYYPDEKLAGLGHDLEARLTRIYTEEARYAVVIFSEHYFNEDKLYTKIELSAIQQRMDEDAGIVYMLPVRLQEHLSLEAYPKLDKLIYFKWNYDPDVLAAELAKLLGKELLTADETEGQGNIIYNSANQSVFIAGSDAANINQTIIFSVGETPLIITRKESEAVTLQQFNFTRPRDTKYACPYCSAELDATKYGINKCDNCGKVFFIENPEMSVRVYKDMDPLEAKEFNKIRSHIRNKIRDRDYQAAYKFCLKAEEIAPGQVATWEHFTLVVFLREIYREKTNRLPTDEIIRLIRPHIEKCKDCGISDDDYDGLVIDIANKLFTIAKSRINSLRAQYRDGLGYEKWTRTNLLNLQNLLRSFEICYGLYDDTLFLEEYVNELTKPNKWLERIPGEEVIVNTTACAGFNAAEKFKRLVDRIIKKKNDYSPPQIAEQRFEILSSEPFEEKPGTAGQDNIFGGDEDFKIISIE